MKNGDGEKNMPHSTIQFGKNTVTKSTTPDTMRVEVEKFRKAFEIGKDCGLFRVPKVLDYDETKGVAVFERIKTIQPVRDALFMTSQVKSIMEMVGRSLAIIHQKLTLPREMIIALPTEIDFPGTEVFLHGDFNGYNVCFEEHSSMIIVLDWQTAAIHGGRATYGSRYFDLLWFVNYMLWTPTLRYLWGDPVNPVTKVFLKSYFKEAGILYDTEMFVQYAKSFFETEIPLSKKQEGRMTRCLFPRSYILTQRFIESLKTMTSK